MGPGTARELVAVEPRSAPWVPLGCRPGRAVVQWCAYGRFFWAWGPAEPRLRRHLPQIRYLAQERQSILSWWWPPACPCPSISRLASALYLPEPTLRRPPFGHSAPAAALHCPCTIPSAHP